MRLAIGNIWKKLLPGKSVSNRRAVLFLSCDSLPLDRFIAIIVTGDLRQLIISGEPSLSNLAEAWANIYAEYVDMNGDNEGAYILRLQTQIEILNSDIIEVETALYCLTLQYRQDLVDILEDHGITVELDINDYHAYIEALERANDSLAFQRLQLETLSKEYLQYMTSRSKDTIDKAYFMMQLRRLARFNQVVVIKPQSITVEEFVMMLRDYFEHLTKDKKQLEPDGY